MTAQTNNQDQAQQVSQFTLYNKGVGLKLITSKNGKPLLIGSCLQNGKQIFGSPFTAKKPNKDGTFSEGLALNIIDGEVITYMDNNGVERQKVQTPQNRDEQVSQLIYLYEQGVDTGLYVNGKGEATVTPVDEAPDGSYRPDYNVVVKAPEGSQPTNDQTIPF